MLKQTKKIYKLKNTKTHSTNCLQTKKMSSNSKISVQTQKTEFKLKNLSSNSKNLSLNSKIEFKLKNLSKNTKN